MGATSIADASAAPRRAPLRPVRVWPAGAAAVITLAICLARLDHSLTGVASAAAAAVLVWVAAIDLESRLLPDRIVLPSTALLLLAEFAAEPARAASGAAAAVGAAVFLLVAALLRPGALGMGDVKLALLIGVLLGGAVIEGLAIGFGLVSLAAVVLVTRRGRLGLKLQVPLGPFLTAGAIATLLLTSR